MKTVAIHTLGCKTNQLESSMILDDFIKLGWSVVDFGEKADLYVINTCTVTAKSDSESNYLIRKAKRTNPQSLMVVMGCYAQVSPEEIAELDEVDLIIGNSDKLNIAKFIDEHKNFKEIKSKIFVSDIMQQKTFINKPANSASGRTRANIKVQDGCNNRCSYCIIPFARGKSRSNSLQTLLMKSQTSQKKALERSY